MPRTVLRREYIQAALGALALVTFSLAFGRQPEGEATSGQKGQVRLAYLPNLTHAPALIGVADHLFQNDLSSYGFSTAVVNAGPEAMEALLAGSIDMAYVGPSPALNTYLRSEGRALKIVAGVCSGGASLLARDGVPIKSVADLANRRVAVPEIGGTQDVSLRHFLKLNGLAPKERGGNVEVIPIKNPEIVDLFKAGQLDAAWVPEPWASRLEAEAHAHTVADERDLWPNRRFTSTVLVASASFLKQHPDAVDGVVRANREAIEFIQAYPAQAQREANGQIAKLTGRPLRDAILRSSWSHLSFGAEVDQANLLAFARAAKDAGYGHGDPALLASAVVPEARLAVAESGR
ncbi:MAG TPA: ABC transporter substrate-binding protein [Fimbriimonas sp.]|nr:ABC transporter substrate-binding protein [Fimbriimonas sp.]